MHQVHHTHAVVLQSKQSGESNKRVWLFTKEFGLIIAQVQGVRKSEAKLKSHIQDYSFISADIVKGREVWRLVNAKELYVPTAGQTRSPLIRAYVRTLALLARFLIDEGPHEDIFSHVESFSRALSSELDPKIVDAVSMWKILALLGYIAPDEHTSFILQELFPEVCTRVTDENKKILIAQVKQAISASHL